MSFDQDPNEQANISGADLEILCDELKAKDAEIERLRAALNHATNVYDSDIGMERTRVRELTAKLAAFKNRKAVNRKKLEGLTIAQIDDMLNDYEAELNEVVSELTSLRAENEAMKRGQGEAVAVADDDADCGISWIIGQPHGTNLYTHTQPVAAIDELAEFERVYIDAGHEDMLAKNDYLEYKDPRIQEAWWGWQARAKLNAQP